MLNKMTNMKGQHLITDMLFTFWFGWFAIAGVAVTAFIDWMNMANLDGEEILLTGSVIGIVTGGVAAIALFIINWRKNGEDFGEDRTIFRAFTHRRP
jgi:hypothetical protein